MKKLLLMLICATGATSAFAIVDGLPLNDLIQSKPKIADIAKSAVGLVINDKFSCTGFAISKNQIVTAAHCVYDLDNKKPMATKGTDITIYTVTANNNSGVKQAVHPEHVYLPDPANITVEDGGDIAIVTLPNAFSLSNYQTPALLANFLDTKQLGNLEKDQQYLIDTLLKGNFYKKNPTIYRIGWGAKKSFEYSSVAEKCTNVQTPFFYNINRNNTTVRMYPPSEVDDYKTLLTYQLSKKVEGLCTVEYNDDDNVLKTNYNQIKQDDKGDQITEGGDSGGPTIGCTNDECFVIGAHVSRTINNNVSTATSLLSYGAANLMLKVYLNGDGKFVKQLF